MDYMAESQPELAGNMLPELCGKLPSDRARTPGLTSFCRAILQIATRIPQRVFRDRGISC